MHALALSLYHQGKYQEAEGIIQQVMELRIKVLGLEHPDTFEILFSASMAIKRQGRYQEAEKINRILFQLQAKVLGLEHPATIASMKSISKAYVVGYHIRRKILQLSAVIFGI
jgi:tetratricopeptide (TPR) repeat protein